jgi:hypothetical protein
MPRLTRSDGGIFGTFEYLLLKVRISIQIREFFAASGQNREKEGRERRAEAMRRLFF